MKTIRSAAVIVLIIVAACTALCLFLRSRHRDVDVTLAGGILDISGIMNEDMLSHLELQKWSSVKSVRFTSSGGLPAFSLPIAKLLALKGRPISIHEMCASACIDVLVINNGKVTIEPDTVVLLHNTAIGQAMTLKSYPRISRFLLGIGKKEEQWLIANGVDPRLLLFSESAMMPVCVSAPMDDPKMADNLVTVTRFDVWAPRSTTLARLGVQAAQGWTQDASSVSRIMQSKYPKANLNKLRPADEPAIPRTDIMINFLNAVPACRNVGTLR